MRTGGKTKQNKIKKTKHEEKEGGEIKSECAPPDTSLLETTTGTVRPLLLDRWTGGQETDGPLRNRSFHSTVRFDRDGAMTRTANENKKKHTHIAASRTRWPADKIVWNEMRKQKSKEREREMNRAEVRKSWPACETALSQADCTSHAIRLLAPRTLLLQIA